MSKLNGHADRLNAASPDAKASIKSGYGKHLDKLTSAFTEQKNRLLGNNEISNVLKPVLDQVKLFN